MKRSPALEPLTVTTLISGHYPESGKRDRERPRLRVQPSWRTDYATGHPNVSVRGQGLVCSLQKAQKGVSPRREGYQVARHPFAGVEHGVGGKRFLGLMASPRRTSDSIGRTNACSGPPKSSVYCMWDMDRLLQSV